MSLAFIPCEECDSGSQTRRCEFCGHTYCEAHWPKHLAWEKRYEGLAEEASKLWRKQELNA